MLVVVCVRVGDPGVEVVVVVVVVKVEVPLSELSRSANAAEGGLPERV